MMSTPTDGDKEKKKLTPEQKAEEKKKLDDAQKETKAEITEDFKNFMESESYKKLMEGGSVSTGEIYKAFEEYMEKNQKKSSLAMMKKFLGREVCWDDIKDLEIKTSTTIDREISSQFLKKQDKEIQRACAVIYFQKFTQNINGHKEDRLRKEWGKYLFRNKINVANPKSMQDVAYFKDIDSVFDLIKTFLSDLPDDIKDHPRDDKIMAINIRNKEILDYLTSIGVVDDNSKKAFEDNENLSDDKLKNKVGMLKTAFDGLVKLELVGELSESFEAIPEHLGNMYKIQTLPKLGKIIDEYGTPNDKWAKEVSKTDEYKALVTQDTSKDEKQIIIKLLHIKSKNEKIGEALISLHKNDYDISKLSNEHRKLLMNNLFADYKKKYYEVFAKPFGMASAEKRQQFEKAFDSIFTDILFEQGSDNADMVMRTDSGTTTLKVKRKIISENISKPENIADLVEFGYGFDFTLVPDTNTKDYFYSLMENPLVNNLGYTFPFDGEKFNCLQQIKLKDKSTGTEYIGYPQVVVGTPMGLALYDGKGNEILTESIKQGELSKYTIEKSFLPEYNFGGEDKNKWFIYMITALAVQDHPFGKESLQEFTNHALGKPKTQEEIDTENAKLTKLELEKKRAEFDKQFESLDGDKGAKFASDTVLYIRESDMDSQIPWGGGKRIKMEILPKGDMSKPENTLHGVRMSYVDFNKNSAETEVEFTAEMIRKLKTDCFSSICRFKKKDSIKDFFEYIQSVNISKNYNPAIDNFTSWKSNTGLSVEGNKLMRQENSKKEEVKYIGKITNRKVTTKDGEPDYSDIETVTGVFFKVTFMGNEVKIDYTHGGYSEVMDYTSFMLFISDKGLSPFTETEYKKTQNSIDDTNTEGVKTKKPFTMVSLGGLLKAFKKIPEKMKYYSEQRQKIHSIRAYGYMIGATGWLGYIPGMGDFKNLKNDYLSESDNMVWSLISKHKDTLMREGSGGGVHAKRIATVIENSIFKKMDSWLIGSNIDFQYKACGYLLYSLQIGGDAYFRATAKYGGKGYWVRAILGAKHQQVFLSKFQAMQNMLKNDPTNSKLIHQLAQAEMLYLVEQTGKDPKFGSTFGTTLEGMMIGLGDKVGSSKNNDAKKATFEEGGYPHFLGMNRNPEAVGSLQAMMEKVDSHARYKQMFMYMFVPILSGHARNSWTDPTHTGFKKLGRTFGYPLALFSEDRYGGLKISRILDYISTRIGLSGDEIFTKATGWSMDKTRPDNYMNNFKDFFGKTKDWWEKYGDRVISVLNYNSPELLSYATDKKIDKDTKDAISEYINDKVNMSAREKWTNYGGDAIFQSAEINPSFKNNILNMPAGVVEHKMLNFTHGHFKDDLAERLWESVEGKVEQFIHSEVDENIVGFMLKKYNTWFKHTYRGNMKYLISAIHRAKSEPAKAEEYLQKFVADHLKEERGEIHVPGVVNDVMELFQKFILKNLFKIDEKVIISSFGEEYKDSFKSASYGHLDKQILKMQQRRQNRKGKNEGYDLEYDMAA